MTASSDEDVGESSEVLQSVGGISHVSVVSSSSSWSSVSQPYLNLVRRDIFLRLAEIFLAASCAAFLLGLLVCSGASSSRPLILFDGIGWLVSEASNAGIGAGVNSWGRARYNLVFRDACNLRIKK